MEGDEKARERVLGPGGKRVLYVGDPLAVRQKYGKAERRAAHPPKKPCVTCGKPLRRATSRHKCPHGTWCGIPGEEQLATRSRTCERCNAEKTRALRTP